MRLHRIDAIIRQSPYLQTFLCLFSLFAVGIVSIVIISFVYMSVSNFTYWSDLNENFTRDVSLNKEEQSKFWKSSDCGSRN